MTMDDSLDQTGASATGEALAVVPVVYLTFRRGGRNIRFGPYTSVTMTGATRALEVWRSPTSYSTLAIFNLTRRQWQIRPAFLTAGEDSNWDDFTIVPAAGA